MIIDWLRRKYYIARYGDAPTCAHCDGDPVVMDMQSLKPLCAQHADQHIDEPKRNIEPKWDYGKPYCPQCGAKVVVVTASGPGTAYLSPCGHQVPPDAV